jgi:hypothetical protein
VGNSDERLMALTHPPAIILHDPDVLKARQNEVGHDAFHPSEDNGN